MKKHNEKANQEPDKETENLSEEILDSETESQTAGEGNAVNLEAGKRSESEDFRDKYLRLQAEFDNYKKRAYRERGEFVKFANEGLILELLDILDNFERGIKAAELKKDFGLLHQGVDMISRQLHSLLESKGLIRIKSVGEKFDPHRHEAVEVAESPQVTEDTVSEELQPGYLLNGRIIRTAKVKVLKAQQAADKEVKEEEKEDGGSESKEED